MHCAIVILGLLAAIPCLDAVYISRTVRSTVSENEDGDILLAEVGCSSCWIRRIDSVSSNGGQGTFYIDNGVQLRKNQCPDTTCGKKCTQSGCLNAGEVYTIKLKCCKSRSCCSRRATFTLSVTENEDPKFITPLKVWIQGKTVGAGDHVYTIPATDKEGDVIKYTAVCLPDISSDVYRGQILFSNIDERIIADKDLSVEYSGYYYMQVCVKDRRSDNICETLNITIESCFEIPNCEDKLDLTITDLYGTLHSQTDFIWTMKERGPPNSHFQSFSSVWHNLRWSFHQNDFKEIEIAYKSGDITVHTNISIHPAYPTKIYESTVEVSNPRYSCDTSLCRVRIEVYFTNWPIKITSLPTDVLVHEDNDDELLLHEVIVYDYNYDYEDNVTCRITNISPYEDNLFDLRDDGQHLRNSYKLYRMACDTPNCGYKKSNFLCDNNTGCFNHNITSSYDVTITCWDAYGSNDSEVFTLNIKKNAAPRYLTLPETKHVESRKTSAYDVLYSVLYFDEEQESMYYEYTYEDEDYPYQDPGYFTGSEYGNWTDNLANITAVKSLRFEPVNKTYIIEICGHERRNEICAELTVKLEEYCGPTPTCSNSEIIINGSYAGVLFYLEDLVQNSDMFEGLSYAIASVNQQYFTVDHKMGTVSINGNQHVSFPLTTYHISAYVYAKYACSYGECSLSVPVNYINEPVTITNLPASVSIHEDDTTTTTIFVLDIQDDNEDDKVTCDIDNATFVEPFYITEMLTGSKKRGYMIKKRAYYGLSSVRKTYSILVTCSDAYGSSDNGTLTVSLQLNEGPSLVNLGKLTELHISPFEYVKNSIVRMVKAVDTERDQLTFTCSVQTSMVPFSCHSGSDKVYVLLRRDIDPVLENGKEYDVDICVSDAKHHNSSCGLLRVTITSDKTAPEISNLPSIIYVPENATTGSTLFTANISDPDVGETHFVTATVYPRSEKNTFLISSDGTVVLNRRLDYERLTDYLITFRLRDTYLHGEEEKTLTISVTNVNEGNVLEIQKSYLSFKESTEANTTLEDLGLTCMDEDVGDTLTFSLDSIHRDYFSINEQTGEITLVKEWDLESGLPTSTMLYISCSDGELNSYVAVTVNIEDVDEHAPKVLPIDLDKPLQINSNTSLTTTLLRVYVQDDDYNGNNNIVARIVGNGLGQRYFRTVPVNNRKRSSDVTVFDIKLKEYMHIAFDNDKQFQFTVMFSGGVMGEETGITATGTYTADPPIEPTKPSKKCLTCTNNGKVLIAVLAIEVFLIVGFITHALYSMLGTKHEVHDKLFQNKSEQSLEPDRNNKQDDLNPVARSMFRNEGLGSAKSTGSRRRPISLKTIKLPKSTLWRSRVDSVDSLSSSSSSQSDTDTKEFKSSTPSKSNVGSLSNKRVLQSNFHSKNSSATRIKGHLNSGGLPLPVYSSQVSSSRWNAKMQGDLAPPIVSSTTLEEFEA